MQAELPPDQATQIALFEGDDSPNAFRKPVQVIHSRPQGAMSLLNRKLANAWMKNAAETPSDAEGWWTLNTSTLESIIGFNSKNRAHLIDSARSLMGVIFEWDVVAPAGKRSMWKASVLFPEVEIFAETIRYQISKPIMEQVLNPEIYALIDINVLNKFRRGPSLALYEHCFRFEKVQRTSEVDWTLMRDMIMGESADAKSYQEYKVFKDKVLKLSITEVNSVSDINIELLETKEGRRIKSISFLVNKKARRTNPEPIIVDENLKDLADLVSLGLMQHEAGNIIKKYSHQQIVDAIDYTRARLANTEAKPITNIPAYFKRAITQAWKVPAPSIPQETFKTKPAKPSLAERYLISQINEAESYFFELSEDQRLALIAEYNGNDISPALKIKNNKPGRAVRTEFYKWLALKTWGAPTSEDLLEFAEKMMQGG